MALAKYLEDIEERWLDDTRGRYESRLAELFLQFASSLAPAGDVYLTRSGRRMEDIEVCEVGQSLSLKLISTPGAATPEVTIEEGSARQISRPRTDGSFPVKFVTPGSKRLQATSGGYIKSYTVYAVEPFRVEHQPDFTRLIHSLTDYPPKWTDESFGVFRNQLEKVLLAHTVPQLFIDGIVEYFLGLFHEEQRRPAFRERFQQAFGNLRWFIPYSDVARLICTQFLYCANEFAAAEKICQGATSRLRSSIAFFLNNEHITPKISKPNKSVARQAVSLLIALPDLLTFQAIEAIRGNRPDEALELCSAIRKQMLPKFEKERAARLSFLEARAKELNGDAIEARNIFENLLHSPWPPIAEAAAKHINSPVHG